MFADKLSGKNAARPELGACLDYLRPGDTLVVTRLDRLKIRHAGALLTRPDETISSIARLLGVSRATLYKHIPEITGGRRAPAAEFAAGTGAARSRSSAADPA